MSIKAYLEALPAERKSIIQQLDQTIQKKLKGNFEAGIQYGMIGYYVPHKHYPSGYHCNPKEPLPFIQLASQKNFVAVYHMGMYASPELLAWFEKAYAALGIGKPDMGKSCIRFKKIDKIPVDLIGELVSKMSVDEWIQLYEQNLRR
jgi:hypothetical protein